MKLMYIEDGTKKLYLYICNTDLFMIFVVIKQNDDFTLFLVWRKFVKWRKRVSEINFGSLKMRFFYLKWITDPEWCCAGKKFLFNQKARSSSFSFDTRQI